MACENSRAALREVSRKSPARSRDSAAIGAARAVHWGSPMTQHQKRNAILGGLAGLALGLVFLVPARPAAASNDAKTEEACSSGVPCGGSCCNNRTDRCCKGSCIGANDKCQ